MSVMAPILEFFIHLIDSGDSFHTEIFDIDSFIFIFMDL